MTRSKLKHGHRLWHRKSLGVLKHDEASRMLVIEQYNSQSCEHPLHISFLFELKSVPLVLWYFHTLKMHKKQPNRVYCCK